MIENFLHQLSAPITVSFEVTNSCNLNCVHCYAKRRPPRQDLSLDNLKQVLRQLARSGVFRLALMGGEPLSRPDFFEIVKFVKSLGYKGKRLQTSTNGTIITRELAKQFRKTRFSEVQVSLDGCREVNDKIRGPGNFERTLRGITFLQEEGIKVTIAMTVLKVNFFDVPNLLNFARDHNIEKVRFLYYTPVGERNYVKRWIPSPEQEAWVSDYLNEHINDFRKMKIEYHPGMRWFFRTILSGKLRIKKPLNGFCLAGIEHCVILPNGDVIPCVGMPFLVAGNVIREDFQHIWRNSTALKFIRDFKPMEKPCVDCEVRQLCRGGCRSFAYYLGSGLSSPDPRCPKVGML